MKLRNLTLIDIFICLIGLNQLLPTFRREKKRDEREEKEERFNFL